MDRLFAFDATGAGCIGTATRCEPLWEMVTDGDVASSPAVSDGRVFVGSNDGKLYAADAGGVTNCSGVPKTCAPLWTAVTGGPVQSSPAVVGGVVYVGSDDGKLYAFDAAGVTDCAGSPKVCQPLWTAATGGPVVSSPAVSGGTVYVGSDDHRLYAFDALGSTGCSGVPKTCSPLWSAVTGNFVTSSPAVAEGFVYVGSGDGTFYAFDAAGAVGCSGTPKTCAPRWTATTLSGIVSSPAVASGRVYVASLAELFAFDAAGVTNCTGSPTVCSPLWTSNRAFEQPIISSPAVANGLVFIGPGSPANHLNAFDAAGVTNCAGSPAVCSPVWSADVQSTLRSTPAVSGGMVYAGTDDGLLYAFALPGPGEYHALSPARVLDTRDGTGGIGTAMGPGATVTLTVAGRGGVPATGVSAVAVNLAVTSPTGGGYMTVYPSGTPRPLASSINFAPGQTVANMVVAKLGAAGTIDIFNATGSTQVVVDVEGWFGAEGAPAGSRYTALNPTRILDTRDGTGGIGTAVGPGATVTLAVAGRGGVPATGVSAVAVNLAVTSPTADGYLTVFPSGTAKPLASSINFGPGKTVANMVMAKLGPAGTVDIFNAAGSTQVIVDVEGWFGAEEALAGSRYTALSPARILDTRDGTGGIGTAVGPGATVTLQVLGRGGVPLWGAAAVAVNVAVTSPTSDGYLTIYPSDPARPLASSINFAPGQTVANMVVAKVSDGTIDIFNASGSTHVIVDVEGWFA